MNGLIEHFNSNYIPFDWLIMKGKRIIFAAIEKWTGRDGRYNRESRDGFTAK